MVLFEFFIYLVTVLDTTPDSRLSSRPHCSAATPLITMDQSREQDLA